MSTQIEKIQTIVTQIPLSKIQLLNQAMKRGIPMRNLGIVLFAVITFCVSPIARADHIQQRGGSAFSARIGPWYIVRQTYEDGSRVCWAHNPNYGRSEPTFSYMVAVGGREPVSLMRFDGQRRAKANETVTLVVGDEQLKLLHRPDDVGNAFSPKTLEDARKITRLLEERQNESPKSFFVYDAHGGKFKFDSRSTTKMITHLEKNCGYVRY